MNKKALAGTIIGLLVGILVLGSIYYFFIYKPSTVKTPNTVGNSGFFPFGNSGDNNNSGNPIDTTGTSTSLVEIPKLRKIWADPVSGFTTFDRKATTTGTSTETVIRFAELSTGHIYETKNTETITKRISNTTLQKYSEVMFLGPLSFVGRRWNETNSKIETFVGSLVGETATSTDNFSVKGNVLVGNIKNIVVYGNKTFNLYTSVGGSLGYIQSPAGSKESLIFKSPLSDWNIDWVSDKLITFETKPSSEELGYFFVLNTETGSFKSIVGDKFGLTAKSNNDASGIIYNESTKDSFLTFYQNVKSGSFLQLRSTTIPEKCIWNKKEKNVVYCFVPNIIPSGYYPDDWYKGKVQFSDNLVRINTDNGFESIVANLNKESGDDIDAIKPSLSPAQDYIYFINKRNGSFWSYDLRP